MTDSALRLPRRASRKRKEGRSRWGENNLAGYLFISPWLIAFFAFAFIPMVLSFALAFTDYHILRGWNFIGLDNFQRMFYNDVRYWRSVSATVKYVVFAVPLRLVFALGVAMLLNTNRRGVAFYRAAFYAPSVVGASVAVAVMWREVFNREGLVNAILGQFGQSSIWWLGHPDYAIWTLILLAAWQFGSPMLIFLAGLKQIPEQLYESASIDGANGIQKFVRITLPLLHNTLCICLTLAITGALKVFDLPWVMMGQGMPMDRSWLLGTYMYQQTFNVGDVDYGSAIAIVLVVLGVAISQLANAIFKEKEY